MTEKIPGLVPLLSERLSVPIAYVRESPNEVWVIEWDYTRQLSAKLRPESEECLLPHLPELPPGFSRINGSISPTTLSTPSPVPSRKLVVTSMKVNPKDLAINKRHKSNATLPQEVKDAKHMLATDVAETVFLSNWQPPERAAVSILAVFTDMRNDLDGILKHTLDAIQDGIRMAGRDWNDRSVWSVWMTRRIGDRPWLMISMGEYDGVMDV